MFCSGTLNYIILTTVHCVFAFRLYLNFSDFSGGTGVLWWLYVDHRNALEDSTLSVFGKEVGSDNVKALLVYAIVATIFTVCLSAQVLYVYMHVFHCFTKYITYTNLVLNKKHVL